MKSNENASNVPSKCPKCNSELEEHTGKYGKYLGCTNIRHWVENAAKRASK